MTRRPQLALSGLRVVDAATLAAGPMVATALGEYGADVIKVEQPLAGDPLRTWGARRRDIGLFWKSMSRNKSCVTIDFRHRDGQELLHALLDISDVLVVNSRPSALARWCLDYESIHARHPQLVMLHVTGFGGGGPASDRPGFGTLAEAMSGFAHVTGEPDGPPTLPPFFLADGVAALSATYAVMMALYHRDVHGGGGQLVDVSLVEPLARLVETATLTYEQLAPSRNGPETGSTPALPATRTERSTASGSRSPQRHRTSRRASSVRSADRISRLARTTSTRSRARPAAARSTSSWPRGSASGPSTMR